MTNSTTMRAGRRWGRKLPAVLLAAALGLAAVPATLIAQETPASPESISPARRAFQKGVDFMNSSRFLDAVEQFQLALDQDAEFIEAYRRLAYVYTQMGATEADYYQDALDTYERLKEKLPPDDVEVRKNIAFVHAAMEDYDAAIATYHEILTVTPQDCSIWSQIGAAEKFLADRAKGEGTDAKDPAVTGRIDKAIQAYTKVTEICPDSTGAYNNLGQMYFEAERYDDAAAVYDKLLDRDSTNVDVLSRLGYLHRKAEQWGQACAVYKQLLDVAPNRIDDRKLYADALKKANKFSEAATQFQMLIDSDPQGNASLYCNLAMIYALDLKDANKTTETVMKGISVNAPVQACLTYAWGSALELKGLDYGRVGEYDRAISTFKEGKLKFSSILGDASFGENARKRNDRLDQLILIQEQTREKAKQQ